MAEDRKEMCAGKGLSAEAVAGIDQLVAAGGAEGLGGEAGRINWDRIWSLIEEYGPVVVTILNRLFG